MGVRIISGKFEIFVFKIKDRIHFANYRELWKFSRIARELCFHLLHVIDIQVYISSRPNKLSELQTADVRHHYGEKRVRANIERHAEKGIAATLIELA